MKNEIRPYHRNEMPVNHKTFYTQIVIRECEKKICKIKSCMENEKKSMPIEYDVCWRIVGIRNEIEKLIEFSHFAFYPAIEWQSAQKKNDSSLKREI